MGNKNYFLGITKNTESWKYEIYFVNDSDVEINNLTMYSGGFTTMDDDQVNTSVIKCEFNFIKPKGYVLIDILDDFDLEFVIYYNMEVLTAVGTEMLTFTIGKRIGFMGNLIPILNRMGRRVYPY